MEESRRRINGTAGAQPPRTGTVGSAFGELLEGFPRLRLFLRIGRFDPNGGKVVLIRFVTRLFFQSCGEMAFLARFIALRTRQPSGNYMVRRAFAVLLCYAIECFAGCIELPET